MRNLPVVLALTALTTLASSCGGGATPQTSPDAPGSPSAVSTKESTIKGRVLVYVKDIGGLRGVFTVAPGEEPVRRFGANSYVMELVPGSSDMLVVLTQVLAVFDLASGNHVTIWDGSAEHLFVAGAAVSPDGSRAALAVTTDESTPPVEYRLITMNIDGSNQTTAVTATLPFPPGFRGIPAPVAWSRDNAIIAYRGVIACGCTVSVGVSGADGSGFRAVGDDRDWWPDAPVARFAVYRDRPRGVGCFEPGHALFIRDLATGDERELVLSGDRAVEAWEWSPDGRELLYSTVGTLPDTRPGSTCEVIRDDASEEFHILNVEAGDDRRVASRTEAHRQWTSLAWDNAGPYVLTLDGREISREAYLRVLGVIDADTGAVYTTGQ